MNENEYAKIKDFLAPNQQLRMDINLFSRRFQTSIYNAVTKGIWMSHGDIAYYAGMLANKYKLPFISMRGGQYSTVRWNPEMATTGVFKDALMATYAASRLVHPEHHEGYNERNWKAVIAAPETAEYIGIHEDMRHVLAEHLKGFAKGIDYTQFKKDWKENNIWINV